ncbi:unnamed protein product [Moneuplotes crassus]|uniref:Uncharacterized protein n=1 Tax=Euplotes crassus TaxID=5936 RepID=A0AAD1U357_EUPCR|nr:unnamed protein product [Moneuplotes crassus]
MLDSQACGHPLENLSLKSKLLLLPNSIKPRRKKLKKRRNKFKINISQIQQREPSYFSTQVQAEGNNIKNIQTSMDKNNSACSLTLDQEAGDGHEGRRCYESSNQTTRMNMIEYTPMEDIKFDSMFHPKPGNHNSKDQSVLTEDHDNYYKISENENKDLSRVKSFSGRRKCYNSSGGKTRVKHKKSGFKMDICEYNKRLISESMQDITTMQHFMHSLGLGFMRSSQETRKISPEGDHEEHAPSNGYAKVINSCEPSFVSSFAKDRGKRECLNIQVNPVNVVSLNNCVLNMPLKRRVRRKNSAKTPKNKVRKNRSTRNVKPTNMHKRCYFQNKNDAYFSKNIHDCKKDYYSIQHNSCEGL